MESPLRFEVLVIETLEEHEGNEEGKDEVEDGCGLMLETVIERPISDESMEQIVFDIPASMADTPEQKRGHLRGGKRCYPPPVMELGLFDPLVVLTMPFGQRFLRMENPQGNLNPFSHCKALRIPGPDVASTLFPNLRFHEREDTLGILKQDPLLSLEHSDHVFVML
jgi:hypothetical protein